MTVTDDLTIQDNPEDPAEDDELDPDIKNDPVPTHPDDPQGDEE